MYFGEEAANERDELLSKKRTKRRTSLNAKQKLPQPAHRAIQELLASALSASGVEKVFIVSLPDKQGKRTILAASNDSAVDAPALYEPEELDTLVDLVYKGRTIGNMVFARTAGRPAEQWQGGGSPKVERRVVDAFACAAGFILGYAGELMEATRGNEESEVLREQKEEVADEVAHARAEELEAVIRQMADGVIIFDASGKVVKFNPASRELLGRDILPQGERHTFPERYGLYTVANKLYDPEELPGSRALRGETVIGAQLVVKRPQTAGPHDEEEVVLSASAAPLKDSAGNITGAVTVLRDITQYKMAERLKDEFLSVVSHELRTPLSAIMGYSDLMLRGVHGALSERQGRALGAVRSNAERLLRLINDLLDVSRFESGVVPLEVGPVNLGVAISRILTQTKVLVLNAGLTVRNEVPQHGLPFVLADEPRLQQIIENLLSNAIKFTPPGGSIVFQARLSTPPADDERVMESESLPVGPAEAQSIIVSVVDTGAGLESDQLSRIWDRFYQVDTSAKRRSGGAGLGLAIVRGLVELHGGQIQATSEGPRRGTKFSFSLPISADSVSNVPQPDRGKDKGVALRSRGLHDPNALTVLVVEDDEDQREIICDMLEMDGYQVVLAEDGEEAVDLARSLVPSAIALDVMLPRSDGWEVLSRLKTEDSTRDIPVLIISVVDQQDFGKKLGADEYLIKPLEAASLRSAVRRLTRNDS